MGSTGSTRVRALLLYGAMAVVLLHGALRPFENLGGKDWNAFLGQAQAELTSVLDDGEFPAWNPWRKGGQVSFAQPESMLLSPVTPIALFTGANGAFKLWLLPLFVIGALGLFVLAGQLGLEGVARLVPGAIFFGASVFPLYVNGGLPNWLFGMALLPWLFVAHRKGMEDHRFLVAAAAAWAGTLWCGSIHHFVFFPLVFAIDAALLAWQRRSLRPLLTTVAWGLIGITLAAVRVVPMLELFHEFPRELGGRERWMPFSLLPRVLFGPLVPDLHGASGGLFVFEGSSVYWINCGAFVGWAAGLLALVAVVRAPRRAAPFLVLALAFTWMALGSGVQPSLWDLVHRLPVFGSMQAPERFMVLVVFALAVLAGQGCEVVESWWRGRFASGAASNAKLASLGSIVLLAAIVVPLLVVNTPIADTAFPLEPPPGLAPTTLLARGSPRPPFKQGHLELRGELWGGPLYEAVLANVGNPSATSDIPSARAVKAEGELGYRGEVWLAEGHGTINAQITPNRIRVTGELAAADRLVVNQNFFPGWRARGTVDRACERHEDLLSLPLPAGKHELLLEFAPASIPLGALLTLAAVVNLALWGLTRRAGRASRPHAFARRDGVALGVELFLLVGIAGWYATLESSGLSLPPPDWRTTSISVGGPRDRYSSLDAAIAEAPAGAVLRLRSGRHTGCRITRGMTLIADPPGGVELSGPLSVAELPVDGVVQLIGVRMAASTSESAVIAIDRCKGIVILQGLAGPSGDGSPTGSQASPTLVVKESDHLLLIDSTLARVDATQSRIALMRCRVGGMRGEVGTSGALTASRSVILLQAGALSAGRGAALELADHSVARSADLIVDPAAAKIDATSRHDRLDDSFPRITFEGNVRAGTDVRAAIRGTPGAKGTLIVSVVPNFVELQGKNAGQFLQTDFARTRVMVPIELPASGATSVLVPADADSYRAGSGFFAQLVFPAGPDPKAKLYSLADGSLIEPPNESH